MPEPAGGAPAPGLAALELGTLGLQVADRVCWVTVDHPPVNLIDRAMRDDLLALCAQLEADTDGVRAVVFQSAVEGFFMAHADVRGIVGRFTTVPPKPSALGEWHALTERLRRLPQATLVKLAGAARGGGSELVLALDMRFAAIGRAVLGQPEVALGIPPGGGGTQRLTAAVGRARALEAILGCEDVDAERAERWGWVNRAVPPDELDELVDGLARRIARFSPAAIRLAKEAVDAGLPDPVPGLIEEYHRLNQAIPTQQATVAMTAFLAAGGQEPGYERDLGRSLGALPVAADDGPGSTA